MSFDREYVLERLIYEVKLKHQNSTNSLLLESFFDLYYVGRSEN